MSGASRQIASAIFFRESPPWTEWPRLARELGLAETLVADRS
jgi:hypothetical protein